MITLSKDSRNRARFEENGIYSDDLCFKRTFALDHYHGDLLYREFNTNSYQIARPVYLFTRKYKMYTYVFQSAMCTKV